MAPLGAVSAAANRRDDGLLGATLDTLAGASTAIGRLPAEPLVHLDAGYDDQTCRQVLAARGMAVRLLPAGGPYRSRPAAAGRWSASCVGQPGRQAALVHRAPPDRGPVLAGAGRRRDRLRPAGPPRLDQLRWDGRPAVGLDHLLAQAKWSDL